MINEFYQEGKIENLTREDLDPMVIFYQTSIIGIRQTLRAGRTFELMAFSEHQLEELLAIMDIRLNGIEYVAEIVEYDKGTMYQIRAIPIRQARTVKNKAYLVKHADIIEYCNKRGLSFKQMSELMGGCDMYISSVLRNHTYGDKSCVTDEMAIQFELLGIDIEVTDFKIIGSEKDTFGSSKYEVNVDDVLNYINREGIIKADFSRSLGRNASFVSHLVRKQQDGWSPVRYDLVPQLQELGIAVRPIVRGK